MNLINIDLLVDNRNRDLWESMSKKFNITIQEVYNDEYKIFIPHNGNAVTIYVDVTNPNSSFFTHELLHLYLTSRQFVIYNSIKRLISYNKILEQIFSLTLLEHINNVIEHTIMLPIYLNLGYEKDYFISDHNETKCTKDEILLISNNFKLGELYNYKYVDYYIGKLLAIKCDSNSNIDYSFFDTEFRNIDNSLHQIICQYYNQWDAYNLEKDVKGKMQESINETFITQMSIWIATKEFS